MEENYELGKVVKDMKTAAVIAEYNPFHNGHLYQLKCIREQLGADIIIVAMSGDFAQRGIPAIIDKYDRCRMALQNGADLVIEIPSYFALGSAEYFASGAVSLLDKLGVVDFLNFGSEAGSLDIINICATILATEPLSYSMKLKEQLKNGLSFPSARSKALWDEVATTVHNFAADEFQETISSPNNVLAIEYVKAIIKRNSSITPTTLKRNGDGYNDSTISSGSFSSANAIREHLAENDSLYDSEKQSLKAVLSPLQEQLPESVYNYFSGDVFPKLMYQNDFSNILQYRLLCDSYEGKLDTYYDVSKQLANIINKNLPDYRSYSDFCLSCKSKELTYTRISRSLMHILLSMNKEIIEELKNDDYSQYARILGFTDNGLSVLKNIKANSSIPIITKLSKVDKILSGSALASIKQDIHCSQIYNCVRAQKYHETALNEYTRQIIRLQSM